MLTSIAGRSVIVTGASKGIGKGIAKVFCQNGGKVLVVARNSEDAEACAEELRRTGGTARACAGDVTKIGDMQTAADTAAAVHGGVDILCANAGIFPQAKIEVRSHSRARVAPHSDTPSNQQLEPAARRTSHHGYALRAGRGSTAVRRPVLE